MRTTEEKHEIQQRIHYIQKKNREYYKKIEQNREEIKWLKEVLYQECEMARKKEAEKITITHTIWKKK